MELKSLASVLVVLTTDSEQFDASAYACRFGTYGAYETTDGCDAMGVMQSGEASSSSQHHGVQTCNALGPLLCVLRVRVAELMSVPCLKRSPSFRTKSLDRISKLRQPCFVLLQTCIAADCAAGLRTAQKCEICSNVHFNNQQPSGVRLTFTDCDVAVL